MIKVPLTHTGEMLLIPERPGLTDESKLPVNGVLGSHGWRGCLNGVIYFNEAASGWSVYCNGCGLRIDVPEGIKTYGQLRTFLQKESAG